MKKTLPLAVLILSLMCLLNSEVNSQGTIETRSFNSPILGETKYYRIYLPEGYYQSAEYYPVVYFFRNHENEWFNTATLKQVADELIEAGLIGKMILVGPNTGSNNGNYWGCINMLRPDLAPSAGIGTGLFEDYIITDLITHIDTTFRTLPNRQNRGIDGFSLGGFISTAISLRNPGVFSSIGSYDGTLMYYNLDDPGIPGTEPDDYIWMNYTEVDPLFDNPRNISYMLEHSVTNILESADSSLLNQIKSNRFHISQGFSEGVGNYWRNINFTTKLREKGIRNSWGNPILHPMAGHTYPMASFHATASLIKHWQTFNGTKISAPTLIDYSITEFSGKTREVIVFNYGPGSLTVTDVQINSSVFSLLNLPSFPITLQPVADSILFSIKFSPATDQSVVDTAYIYSDDSITPVVKIILRGKGGSFKAEPGILYASAPNRLYTINLDSLAAISIGGVYGNNIDNIRELSVDPVTKELFAFGGPSYSIYYFLNLINTKGGDGFGFQEWIEFPAGAVMRAAKIGDDGKLYVGFASGDIFTVDFRSIYWPAPVHNLVTTGLSLSAFAFNPLNGQLWAATSTNQIYSINISNGNTTLIGNSGLNKIIDDMVFDSQGVLYGLLGSGSGKDTLITINTLTGAATILAALNTTTLNAIAISPEPPVGVIATNEILPENFLLFQNYPNPFNPSTTISWQSPVGSHQVLKVFDVLGNEIATLVDEYKPAGKYEVEFNPASGDRNLASGIYFYQLRAGEYIAVKKMLLIK
jgi:S-formylglutathione hydrolase FrmB